MKAVLQLALSFLPLINVKKCYCYFSGYLSNNSILVGFTQVCEGIRELLQLPAEKPLPGHVF